MWKWFERLIEHVEGRLREREGRSGWQISLISHLPLTPSMEEWMMDSREGKTVQKEHPPLGLTKKPMTKKQK